LVRARGTRQTAGAARARVDIADFGPIIGRTLQGVRILAASMLLTEIGSP
jgi:hypothetical protein